MSSYRPSTGDAPRPTRTLTTDDPLAFITVYDSAGQEVAAGAHCVTVAEPLGRFTVEIRVPGRDERHTLVLGSDSTEPLSFLAPPWQSVVPTADNPLAAPYWSGQSAPLARLRRRAWLPRLTGRLQIVAWSPDGPSRPLGPLAPIQVRREGSWLASLLPISSPREPRSGCIIVDRRVGASTYHLSFSVPRLGRRAQAVTVARGWTTRVFAHLLPDPDHPERSWIDFASAVVVLEPGGPALREDGTSFRTTEAVLDALFFGRGLSPESGPEGAELEPVRQLATGYAYLLPYLKLIDQPDLWSGTTTGGATASGSRGGLSPDPFINAADVDAAEECARRVLVQLPDSPDARILAISALWLRHLPAALRASGNAIEGPTVPLPRRGLPRRIWVEITLLLLGLMAGGMYQVLLATTPPVLPGAGSPSRVALMATVAFAGVSLTAWDTWRAIRARGPITDTTPMLAPAMEFLLRLSALQTEACLPRGPLVDVALRLTQDCLWTRWAADISAPRAHKALRTALARLAEEAGKQAVDEGVSPSAWPRRGVRLERAARHVAVSLQLPLALIRKLLQWKPQRVLEQLLLTPRSRLQAALRSEQSVILRTSQAPMKAAPRGRFGSSLLSLALAIFVAVLAAAILLPGFGTAREHAKTASCQSNLRQIATAVVMYAQDYDEQLPGSLNELGQNIPDPAIGEQVLAWPDALMPYLKNAGAFRCSSAASPAGLTAGQTAVPTSYLYNGVVALQSYASIEAPASTILFREDGQVNPIGWQAPHPPRRSVLGGAGANASATEATHFNRARFDVLHQGGGHTLLADGHVKFFRAKSDIRYEWFGAPQNLNRGLPEMLETGKAADDAYEVPRKIDLKGFTHPIAYGAY
jgi:prepilin-type processing-associated H-X9-DG protein